MDIETYDHFIFENLRNPPGELELCSLRVGGHDLGSWLRFTPPQPVTGFDGYYRTVQLRNFPLHMQEQARLLGLYARQVWINPRDANCRLGKWRELETHRGYDFDFSRLPKPGLFAGGHGLDELAEPVDPHHADPAIPFDTEVLHWDSYDPNRVLPWSETGHIQISKHWREMDRTDHPLLHLTFGRLDGYDKHMAAPRSVEAPLYAFLSQRFGIAPADIGQVLSSRQNIARTLWTCLPMLAVAQRVRLDSRAMARQLQSWLLAGADGPLQIGPLHVLAAEACNNDEPFGRYPPQSIWFVFSGVNGKAERPDVVATFERAKVAADEPEPEFRPSWYSFFEWDGRDLDIGLSFEVGGHGHGSIGLSTSAYLDWLHALFPEPDAPVPVQTLKPDFVEHDIYYYPEDARHVSPRLDPFDENRRVTFWRGGTWQGFSEGPWSVRWQAGDIVKFECMVEDEMRDRGGPYDYLGIRLKDGSCFGIRTTGKIDADGILDFLLDEA
ncbi:MAG: hypothetical protein QM599_04320 [Pseudoxanthomonas sp.]